MVTRRLQAERRTGSVRRPKTGVLPTVLRNQPTTTLLDLSAAFDTVDHEILLDRLHQAFGIRGSALKWIRSFVTGRVQRVVFAGEKSVESSVTCGVPHGQCPGPDTIPAILR